MQAPKISRQRQSRQATIATAILATDQATKGRWVEALALLNELTSFRMKAVYLLAAFLLSAFIFIKRDRAYATVCASEFLTSALIYPALSIWLTWQTWGNIQTFLFTYAIKDFVFIVLLSRIYTPSKLLFMLALFISMIANWSVLALIELGYYIAYDLRPLVMRGCIALQLASMVFTLVKGDDNDDNGITWRRKRTGSRVSYFSRMGHL